MTQTATKPRPRRARVGRAPTTKLYLAYGSNLNLRQMRWRCPAAVKIGTTVLPDTRLIFRGVADVEVHRGAETHVGVWRITPACEAELDIYEGCRPNGRGLYRKEYLTLQLDIDGERVTDDALIYVMNRDGYGQPARPYYSVIEQGYRDFGLPLPSLRAALAATLREQEEAL